MKDLKLYFKHLFATFVFSAILLNMLFYYFNSIKKIVASPSGFLTTGFSDADLQFAFVFIGLIIIAVLISYIFYLLLTFNTRFELIFWNKTKSLATSKEQFRRLYDSAPVPYIILGKNAEIHELNKAALRFFGVVSEEVEGKNLFSYIAQENKDKSEKFFQYYKSKISINREELQFVTKSGKTKFVLLSVFGMHNIESQDNVGLAILLDITEQKLLDKAKTEFVSLASHQLRAPLATTKWYTEMLTSGDLGELNNKQKEYIDKLYVANENMIELVDVLLNVSRIEMGSLVVDNKPTNVSEIAESVLNELYPQISKKNIYVEKQYNGLFNNVETDSRLLRIVIQNLISNSVKYTPDGGTITIVFEYIDNKNSISVSDTGVGIPKDAQPKIFTKLFRAENVRKLSSSQGTGLGLYLVKSIMEGLGGDITFVSEENKGSTFNIRF